MIKELRVALIGLDTSHTIEFARRMQAPDCAPEQRVVGMRAVSCLRFETPFQDEEGLNKRQEQLEQWGVKVTTNFEEAVADCDAIMLEINDPAYHLEYFTKCADLGKPIFLDKPLADTIESGRKIYQIAKEKNVRVFSSSSLRFVPQLIEACMAIPEPKYVTVYGPLGKAPAGSSIVWYGVHAFEMLERAMGRGAVAVTSRRDGAGVVAIVDYPEGVRGVVELNEGSWIYGGCLRTKDKAVPYTVNMARAYSDQLELIGKFFRGSDAPVEMEDTLEVMAMLDAAERSVQSGKTEAV
ncbi:MAG: Gfo/Idh/MocA family oxidoreductase [Armatimonadota bacterium]|nr:Gfo/Idh/MocA family oxidoreductase [Armatimonadota bacterium]